MEIKLFIEIPWILFAIISFLIIYFSNCSDNLKNFSFFLISDCFIIGIFYLYKIYRLKQIKILFFEFLFGLSFIILVTYNLYLNVNLQCTIHVVICLIFIIWSILRYLEIFYSEKKQYQTEYEEII